MEEREPERPTDAPAESAEPPGRRYPSTIGGACYLVCWAPRPSVWRSPPVGTGGSGCAGSPVSLLVAAVLRLLLPSRDAGMLAVRRRALDVALLAVVGVALFVLSVTIPDQPPL